ncbi:hypothetical protein [Colwellia echini]|uniref:C-methyltransferase domain-containing protein n=1 Tax=Colwellia echini TaxID=1982103 RepID=A0ABY3MWN6_9GAMM|nr:hypothetical protein [Colwellia echini]TYK65594.1 hypothetical protein CWS31_009525 [Colwellia echini]
MYTPGFVETNGGSIAMHRLCDLINYNGFEAFIWLGTLESEVKVHDDFNTPAINTDKLDDFIVVYTEIVSGNPLNAKHVIRWFLNKPGFFTNKINYGNNELYFYQQIVFNDTDYNSNLENKLYVSYFNKKLWQQTNFNKRSGSGYLLRKGRGREISHNLENSIKIDGMNHSEMEIIFNKVKYFYSYDLQTAYTMFAAMCGCIPIVIPQKNVSACEWQPREELRYGIAYGDTKEEIAYSNNTREKIIPYLDKLNEETKSDVKSFIKKSQSFFSINYKTKQNIETEKLNYIKRLKETDNKILLFGTGSGLVLIMDLLERNGIQPDYFCDNDPNKIGTNIYGYRINKPDEILSSDNQFVVLITSMFISEVTQQIKKYDNVKEILSGYDD